MAPYICIAEELYQITDPPLSTTVQYTDLEQHKYSNISLNIEILEAL